MQKNSMALRQMTCWTEFRPCSSEAPVYGQPFNPPLWRANGNMPDKIPEPHGSLPPFTGSCKNEWQEGSPEPFKFWIENHRGILRTQVMFSSLLPAEDHGFGKERRTKCVTAEDGIGEMLVSQTVVCSPRTKGPGQNLSTLHRDCKECVWQTILH